MKNSYYKKIMAALCLTVVLVATIGVIPELSIVNVKEKVFAERMERLDNCFAMEDPPLIMITK